MGPLPIQQIVIGTSDEARTREFWALFGYLDRDGRLESGRGARLVLRESSERGPERGAWDLGPRGLDIYVHDLDRALARLADAGVVGGPVADISIGPVRMRQCAVLGPSAEPVVLVESTHRRPSLLDEGAWCSEVYSVVWCVPSREVAMTELLEAGASAGVPMSFSDPSLGPYLSLPEAEATLEMVTMADDAGASTRLELLSFPGRQHSEVRGRSGVTAIVFADGSEWSVSTEGAR